MIQQINGLPLTVEKKIHQQRQNDEIILTVYRCPFDILGDHYFYSLQIHLGRLIRSIFPRDMKDASFTPLGAKIAAVRRLRQVVKSSPAAKKRLDCFDLLQIEQREFDF